jgi:site-specific DNA-cytosine methylase
MRKQSIVQQWSTGKSEYGIIIIGLKGCPYSIRMAESHVFPKIRRRVFWVARDDPLMDILRKTYRHPTFPIVLAVPISIFSTMKHIQDMSTRPRGIVRIGGLSDVQECIKKRNA